MVRMIVLVGVALYQGLALRVLTAGRFGSPLRAFLSDDYGFTRARALAELVSLVGPEPPRIDLDSLKDPGKRTEAVRIMLDSSNTRTAIERFQEAHPAKWAALASAAYPFLFIPALPDILLTPAARAFLFVTLFAGFPLAVWLSFGTLGWLGIVLSFVLPIFGGELAKHSFFPRHLWLGLFSSLVLVVVGLMLR
jgi:hypothetical protein